MKRLGTPGGWLGTALLGAVLSHAVAAEPAAAAGQSSSTSGECVVLLHGLGRTARSMAPLARFLRRAGYRVVNVDYSSRSDRIESLAEQAVGRGLSSCRAQGARRVHFVTHSLGGILVRAYLARRRPAALGRVVMLSPPNHGSEIADALRDNVLFRWLDGPAGEQLVTGPRGLPSRLGPADFPVGVITGSRAAPWDLWWSRRIPGEDDGKVSVASARLEGMRDCLVVPYSHTFIMRREAVMAQVLYFLREGRFRGGPHAASCTPGDTHGAPPASVP